MKAKLLVLILLISHPFLSYGQATAQKTVGELKADLQKIEASIEATREKMKSIGDARFLPELYFILAELHTNKSRYMYSVKVLSNKGVPAEELDFTAEKRPKQQAIELYQQILDKFPNSPDRDKAMFFMAHEYRELGDLEKMFSIYQKLTKEFPTSLYWSESQLILANHVYEVKKDVDFSIELYRQILARPVDHFTPLARYKMGLALISKGAWKEALLAFEGVLTTDASVDLSKLPDVYRKTDVRREALVTMVLPYSELNKIDLGRLGADKGDPLQYFKRLSPNLASYQKVLQRLARRMIVKNRFIDSTRVSFALLQVAGDLETRMEAVESVYRAMKDTRQPWPIVGYVEEVAKTAQMVKHSLTLGEKEKRAALTNYEVFARDVATRLQRRAKTTRSRQDYRLAIYAYNDYLWAFPHSKFRSLMRLNLAESYFNIGKLTQAGVHYEFLARSNVDPKRTKEFYDSAIQAFTQALKDSVKLTILEMTEARNGLRSAGKAYVQRYKTDPAVPEILFNIGRTHYDERSFDEAVKAFEGYLARYPRDKNSALAADLILDSFNQREDFDGLIAGGNRLLRLKGLDSRIRSNVSEVIKQAQLKKVQVKSGDLSSAAYAKNLLKLAEEYKGTNLGEQALFEAFVSLKAKKDPQAYTPGETLLVKYGNSKYAKDVTSQMGQMAITTADFRRAALYFETYSQKYPSDPQARQLLQNAAQFREAMGDYREAAVNYQKLGNSEAVARNHYLASEWRALMAAAPSVGGVKGAYWQGIALHRTGQAQLAKPHFQNASSGRPNGFEESTMAAHALYLLSAEAMQAYQGVQMTAGQETQAVQAKNQMLQQLTAQLNRVIQFGNGRWTIAALYGLGRANAEFGEFVKRAPIPQGLTQQQLQQFRAALAQQASQYDRAADGFFKQCVTNAEKFEVFTQFARGCQSKGREAVDEASESLVVSRANQMAPQAAEKIRRQLYDDSRNVKLLIQLAQVYSQNRDFSMAQIVLSRAAEISPQTSSVVALQGSNFLFMNDLEKAHQSFQRALKMNPRDPTALWGMAGLYNAFSYKGKLANALAKARSSGAPLEPRHPYVNSVR